MTLKIIKEVKNRNKKLLFRDTNFFFLNLADKTNLNKKSDSLK